MPKKQPPITDAPVSTPKFDSHDLTVQLIVT